MARNTLLQLRRDTAANWTSTNPVLAAGEAGIETDSSPKKWKVGDGATAWASLTYVGAGLSAQAANTILGNNTGGSAVPTGLTGAQTLALLSASATASFSLNSQRLIAVTDPVNPQDAATKN